MFRPKGKSTPQKRFMLQFAAAAFLLAGIAAITFFNHPTLQKFTSSYEEKLHGLEKQTAGGLEELVKAAESDHPEKIFADREKEYDNLFSSKGIVYLIYENDSLVFWSDHSPSVENYRKEICLDNALAKLRNGWFEVVSHSSNENSSRHFIALILLKNEYSYQNKYLVSEFPSWYQLPKNSELKEFTSENAGVVKTMKGKPLFELSIDQKQVPLGALDFTLLTLYILLGVLVIRTLHKQVFKVSSRVSPNAQFFIFAGALLLLRFIMIYFQLPELFYRTPLYDAAVFGNAASFWFGYFGDIIINAGLLFFLAFVFQSKYEIRSRSAKNLLLHTGAGILMLLGFSVLINDIIRSMVQNSHISFRINDIFSLNFYSYAGFTAAGILFFAFYIFCDTIAAEIVRFKDQRRSLALLFAGLLILFSGFSLLRGDFGWITALWPFAIFASTFILKINKRSYSFSYGLPFIICFSIVSAHLFLQEERIKELGTRKIYAENLSSQQDDVAENLFVDITKKIKQDVKLKNIIFYPPVNSLDLEQRIRQVYFSGYWEKFDILLSAVDSACSPLVNTVNPIHGNNSYFDQQIENNGRPTICKDLFFIVNLKDRTRYIAKIKIEPPAGMNKKPAIIYAELEPKLTPDVIGFPELLLDKSVKTNSQLSDYSYAIYKNNKLVTRSGRYNYNYAFTWGGGSDNDFTEVKENLFHHLVFTSDQTKAVLSLPQDNLKGGFTANSYFFAFFSLLLMAFLFVRETAVRKRLMTSSLNARIQLLLVLVVLISLLSFGIGTFIFVKNQFETQNIETLNQRTKSVLADLQGKFGELDALQESYKDYTSYMLKKVSNVFLTDVTLYDMKGNLYASSQPKLFEEGIVSKKMNPRAFKNVVSTAVSDLVLKENVGKLQYYSSYQPFYNKKGQLLAYLNLPYFSKQSEQEKEITLYITALINVYVILFAISTLAALFISNLVTKPLRLIQQKFSKIRFGKANEPIEWKEKDEIGALVNEYNKMISELEESAEKLAKSERESAWREMAKQVAHEIKNPLTPMKLSIQHLQRTLQDTNTDELKVRVGKVSVMLIEQIETLSHIASEFSAFAKMPKAVIEEIKISELAASVVQLFKETQNVQIVFEDETNGNALVLADKDQCGRVFTNLIKNAVQAIPENREGKIEVRVYRNKKQVIVSVKDNGTGIHEDVMDKIFMPNFSTKTEGMGLGLAMVKNIIESFNGKIWFETTQDEGTVFYAGFEAAS